MESFELIKRFWEFNNKEKLGASATSVYLLLLNVWDSNNRLDFSISDKKIGSLLKLSRPTVRTAKETLRNLGLLSYKIKEGFPCTYKIIIDYEFIPELTQTPIQIQKKLPLNNKQPKQNPIVEKEAPETIPIPLPKGVPTKEEFLAYAKTIPIYDKNSPNIDFKITTRYESWVDNGWKNYYNNPIRNWKISLKNSLPYMLNDKGKQESLSKIPTIRRPKTTYNE